MSFGPSWHARRMLRARATVLLAAALLTAAACGGSSSGSSGSSSGGTTRIVVAVKDGKVDPPNHRVKLDSGSKVRLQVTSDHADEVHVHGFDLKQDLEAGKPAVISFTADQTGVFEVELEDEALQLVQLQVQ
jgi:ABC-type glycerol-3-phosphate transport system substrate-binding protein